jgi:glycosyltransferase involved in cell wall biosynthesis
MIRGLRVSIVAGQVGKTPLEVTQSFIFYEAYRLAMRGIEVHIVRSKIEKDSKSYGIYYHGLEKMYDAEAIWSFMKNISHYPPMSLLRKPTSIYWENLYAINVSKIVEKYNINLIHAHFAYPEGWCALLAKLASNSKLPLVITVHGYDINVLPEYRYGARLNRYDDVKIRNALRHADYVIAVSKDLAMKASKLGARNVIYIPNGVDTKMFNPLIGSVEREKVEDLKRRWGLEDADVIVGFFRHLKPWYGAHYIPLISKLVIQNLDAKIKFVLAGDGDPKYIGLLYRLISRLSLKPNIIYVGQVPRTLMPLAYQVADIVINTSLTDGMPPSTLEAMASGKPVVSFASGGNRDLIIDDYNGYVIQLRNYRDFASKLLYLIENPSEVKRMGLNSRKLAEERYDLEKRVNKIINLYKSLI